MFVVNVTVTLLSIYVLSVNGIFDFPCLGFFANFVRPPVNLAGFHPVQQGNPVVNPRHIQFGLSRHHIIPYSLVRDFFNAALQIYNQPDVRRDINDLLKRLVQYASHRQLFPINNLQVQVFDGVHFINAGVQELNNADAVHLRLQPPADQHMLEQQIHTLQSLITWMPFNFFEGPAPQHRTDDPGNNLEFVPRIVGPDNMALLEQIYDSMTNFIRTGQIVDFRNAIYSMEGQLTTGEQNDYINGYPYNPAHWVRVGFMYRLRRPDDPDYNGGNKRSISSTYTNDPYCLDTELSIRKGLFSGELWFNNRTLWNLTALGLDGVKKITDEVTKCYHFQENWRAPNSNYTLSHHCTIYEDGYVVIKFKDFSPDKYTLTPRTWVIGTGSMSKGDFNCLLILDSDYRPMYLLRHEITGDNKTERWAYSYENSSWVYHKYRLTMLKSLDQNAPQFKAMDFQYNLNKYNLASVKVILSNVMSFSFSNLTSWKQWSEGISSKFFDFDEIARATQIFQDGSSTIAIKDVNRFRYDKRSVLLTDTWQLLQTSDIYNYKMDYGVIIFDSLARPVAVLMYPGCGLHYYVNGTWRWGDYTRFNEIFAHTDSSKDLNAPRFNY